MDSYPDGNIGITVKSDIIGPRPACSKPSVKQIASTHPVPAVQLRKLEILVSRAKQRANEFLIDNFGRFFAPQPVHRSPFLRSKRIRLRNPRAAFSTFPVLGLSPVSPNLSNRQPPKLESSLSLRKQRAANFLIANFGACSPWPGFFVLRTVLRRAFFLRAGPPNFRDYRFGYGGEQWAGIFLRVAVVAE
jgi:hypothetical protein